MYKKILKLILFFIIIALAFLVYKQFKKPNIEFKVKQTFEQVSEIKETIIPQPTKIQESGLPNKHLIQTAFIPQAPEKNWNQPWQDACEEAALLTMDYYYKNQNPDVNQIKSDILKMIDFETKNNWTEDINVEQMATVSSQYLGYKTQIIENPTVDQIKKFISQNIPVVVPASGKTLFKENHFFNDGGPYYHNVVILGYDDTKNQFTVHDVGTQHGKNFHYSYSLLMESIHDFPQSGHKEDIETGDKKVLVLIK